MMERCRNLLLLLACFLGVSAEIAAEAPYRLRNTATNDTIARAVDVVNAAVRDPGLALYFFNDAPAELSDGDRIPVYHVRPDPDHPVVAEVPKGCRCIIVSGADFERTFSQLSEGHVLLAEKETEMLVFLLLHELGHIAEGHYGLFLPEANSAMLNNDLTDSKRQEVEADAFVARVLKREFDRLGSNDPPIEDYDLYFVGTNTILFLSSLSFTIAGEVMLNCFGCRSLGDPQVFWDHGRSHPNFEYRLLKINHALSQSPESQALLEDYERQRDAIGTRGPRIYYADPDVDIDALKESEAEN